MKTLRIPLLASLEGNDLDTALELEGARFSLDQCNWPDKFPYAPFCCGRMARTEDSLVVDFRVSGLDLRVQNLEDGGRSWEDSCCELFLQRPGAAEYVNFEVNAAGKMTAARGTGRGDRKSLTPEEFGQIVRMASIEGPQDYAGGVWTWRVILMIPLELMGLDPDDLPELSEDEKADIQKKRAKVVFEAGNITGIIVGTVLVLLLVTILFSMAYFVRSDITRIFTLFRIQF